MSSVGLALAALVAMALSARHSSTVSPAPARFEKAAVVAAVPSSRAVVLNNAFWLLQALLLVLSGRGAFRDATVTLNSIGRF